MRQPASRARFLPPLLAAVALVLTGSAAWPSRATRASMSAQSAASPRPGTSFADGGVQFVMCEPASPPMPIDRRSSGPTCWYAGTTCAEHGVESPEPFTLTGSIVEGGSVHGGCNPGNFALVYEQGTSPLRLHVCVRRGPGMECPAMVNDHARWDVSPLLAAAHTTRALLLHRE